MSRQSERLRVAFVGKGGAGKSSIAGTFARLLARQSEPVLVLDSDPLPGMPYALGVDVEDFPLPDDVVVEGPADGPRWVLRPELDAATFVERYAVVAPDEVRYLQFGNTRGHISTLQRGQFAWSQVVRELPPGRWHVVGDLPGGTRQAMFGWGKYATTVVVVVEPTTKSLHAARRLLNLSKADWAPDDLLLVANKVAAPADIERIAERLGREVVASVPVDADVYAADRLGRAPLDQPGASAFTAAVDDLVSAVIELHSAQYSEA